MTRYARAILVAAVCITMGLASHAPAAAQDAASLTDFTRTIEAGDIDLSLVHLNNVTVPILFEPPTLYVIRAQAAETTLLYVQGTATVESELDTTGFSIEQDGTSMAAKPINVKYFEGGTVTVPGGERVDGILAFEGSVDLSRPFTVMHGGNAVEFRLSEEAVAQLTTPAAQ